jgi:hypothetical protein
MDPTQTFVKLTLNVTLTGGTAPTWGAMPWDLIRTVSLYSSAGSKQIRVARPIFLLSHPVKGFGFRPEQRAYI